MGATTTGLLAVILGLVVLVWEATRYTATSPSRFRIRDVLDPDLRSHVHRGAVAGFVSVAIMFLGQGIVQHYWSVPASVTFVNWYLLLLFSGAIIIQMGRWLASRIFIKR